MSDFLGNMEDFERVMVAGNSVYDWGMAGFIVLVGVVLSRIGSALLRRWGTKIAGVTETELDDALIEATSGPFGTLIVIGAIAVAENTLRMAANTHQLLINGVIVAAGMVLIVLIARWTDAIFLHGVEEWRRRKHPHIDRSVIGTMRKLTKAVVVVAAVLAVLQTIGFHVMSLLTGLGIGGLAVALAAQETLGNVLGSLQILTDQPFVVGDFIRVDGHFGRVQDIGLRSTKILTPDGIRVVIPNKRIAEAAVENCSVVNGVTETLDLGLTYDTTADEIDMASEIVRRIVIACEDTSGEPTVFFAGFGDFSLNLHVIYFITDLAAVARTRHAVNIAVKREFDAAGLDFAFPTQTLHLVRTPTSATAPGS